MTNKEDYIIASVVKALRVLKSFALDATSHDFTLTEISKTCSLSKASTLRILATLESEDFIRYNEETRKYHLGLVNYTLGSSAYGILDIKKLCYPILKRAAQESHLAVHLAMLAEDEIVVIDRIWPSSQVEVMGLASRIGGTVPIHCTGVGQVLAAYSDKETLNRLIAKCTFEKYSENTRTTEQEFRERIADVRKVGYAINDGEHEPFLKCLTRPIFDSKRNVVAAFSLSGLRDTMTDDKLFELQEISKRTAEMLTGEF